MVIPSSLCGILPITSLLYIYVVLIGTITS